MTAWYVVQTRNCQEQNTEQALLAKGYTVYLPLTLMDKRLRKFPKVITPLFPTYLFIQMNEGEDDFHPIRFTPGVLKIVQMSIKTIDGVEYPYPTPIATHIIDGLRALEDEQGIHDIQIDYMHGDKVRIKRGAFHDCVAVVDGTKECSVFALLEILGQQQRVELDYREVELL